MVNLKLAPNLLLGGINATRGALRICLDGLADDNTGARQASSPAYDPANRSFDNPCLSSTLKPASVSIRRTTSMTKSRNRGKRPCPAIAYA
ncbi:hypothetical protein EN962_27150 [Mesorhizobium sp. M7A.F.Ca.CA.001.09.2.1]|uniref:hypothetical protein n=1 Tax=Mesorhizobium TaxID=68287 RepID=UPI000408C17C|nr:hypothetical protein EN980_19125 [Mesorhizobium sp. M7A.F.Ca.CA.001.13.1.1]RUY71362.1 hypothetical protein EN965_08375 [Mesorhizobium sp. M7A.F.Ca.CA.001.05.1.1]RUY73871.1 hypothetical protein EN962_27150 [Mesorhizobium sp. M7A.F.Ca.CA.001.09.2.1]RUZ01872.1 hypothetical protein EN955_28625 [Mesorhizobium sp. M7A.F.Ca.CA.001.04.2.1]RUZ21172.1 hypothetical protein EN961_14340 [Mesorhizobium sp. M7A.F.Ca.CA.001.09.1.1]RUZ32163.1 hypothetical protein EN953_16415 [Mesorhizobium sp. M7A.F.Ca.CA.0